jgi:hypothetical protein
MAPTSAFAALRDFDGGPDDGVVLGRRQGRKLAGGLANDDGGDARFICRSQSFANAVKAIRSDSSNGVGRSGR